jgi:hypothetical protein
MKIINLTGRPVHINTAVRGALWFAPHEDNEWFGVPMTVQAEMPVSIENSEWDGAPLDPVTVAVKRHVFMVSTRPLPAPVEGVGYIVQSNVLEMYPERDDLYAIHNGDLWQLARIVRTTDATESAEQCATLKAVRETTKAIIREEALAYIDSRAEGARGLTIRCDAVTMADLIARQRT